MAFRNPFAKKTPAPQPPAAPPAPRPVQRSAGTRPPTAAVQRAPPAPSAPSPPVPAAPARPPATVPMRAPQARVGLPTAANGRQANGHLGNDHVTNSRSRDSEIVVLTLPLEPAKRRAIVAEQVDLPQAVTITRRQEIDAPIVSLATPLPEPLRLALKPAAKQGIVTRRKDTITVHQGLDRIPDDLEPPLGPFETASEAEDYLRGSLVLVPQEVVLAKARPATEDEHRAVILVTSLRAILVKTSPDGDLDIHIVHPLANATFKVTEDGTGLATLEIRANKAYAVDDMAVKDAHRLARVAELAKTGEHIAKFQLPARLSFDNIRPIEYYEATLGPNADRSIATRKYGDITITLSVRTKRNYGHFEIEMVEATKNGQAVHQLGIKPFRENNSFFNLKGGHPKTVHVYGTDEDPDEVLARYGILVDPTKGTIKERYRNARPKSALDTVLEILECIELPEGVNDEVNLVEGETVDRLHIQGKVFMFNKEGASVSLHERKFQGDDDED